MICPSCNGSAIIFNARGALTCPKCKGTGSIPEPVTPRKKILILGEAWGTEEARVGMPFVGASGNELSRMLEEAEIDRSSCHLTNVFNLQPPGSNDITNLCTIKALSNVPMPELSKGAYLQDQYFSEVERCWHEIAEVKPNLVIALGNTALWALTGTYGIKALRGTVTEATLGPAGLKVLPTFHPAAILRDWSMRSIAVIDLMKAKRQSEFPEIRRPKRELWIEPTLRDIEFFYQQHVLRSKVLSVDIETAGVSQITCVGFAPSAELGLVIPFVDNRKSSGSYWPTPHQERMAWELVGRMLDHPDDLSIEILGQNFLYDINWLWHKVGKRPRNFVRDTMLKHHAIMPELEKGLGFLGSVYTDEPAWKLMRGKYSSTKRGE